MLSKNKPRGRIAVLGGGTSSERDVSLATGNAITDALAESGWDAVLLDRPEGIVSREELGKYDVVFIAYHGGAGEDGRVQAVLELAGIPYTGSGPLSSGLAMDKILAKRIFQQAGIPTPEWILWEKKGFPTTEWVKKAAPFSLPIVVKPAAQGSTVGITIARDEKELSAGIRLASSLGPRMLFERYIPGREVAVAVLEGVRLPVVEIIPKEGFYDYEHKYTAGASEYIVPADLPRDVALRLNNIGHSAFDVIGLRHYGRVDFRLDGDRPYCLEANSLPGMTSLSLVPKAAGAVGIDFPELVDRIARMALNRSPENIEVY